MKTTAAKPFLNGMFKAQHNELTLDELKVSGKIPAELCGSFIRNGPNPQFPWSDKYHMYEGDGMLHTITLSDGRAGYRNRFIRTPKFLCEQEHGRSIFPGIRDWTAVAPAFAEIPRFTANTHIVQHAGQLLALNEGSPPFVMSDPDSGTGQHHHFDGVIKMTFTAHPKRDPVSGELHGYSYITPDGNVDYIVLDVAGKARLAASFRPPFPSLMHDFAITQNYAVFPIFPLTRSMERMLRGEPLYQWEPELGSYYAVLDRSTGSVVNTFQDLDMLGMHTVNAFEQDACIVLDIVLIDDIPKDIQAFADDSITFKNTLHRLRLNLATGSLQRDRLSDLNVEFPRMDDRWSSLPYQHSYMASTIDPELPHYLFDSVSHFNHQHLHMTTFCPGDGTLFGEPVFAPAGEREGEGYLLTYGYDPAKDTSDLWILKADNITAGPVARIHIPQRVPYGFHGSWISPQN